MSQNKENRGRDTSKREGPIRRDSPLFQILEWIAREIVKDAEKGDQPESDADVVLRQGRAGMPAVVDNAIKE